MARRRLDHVDAMRPVKQAGVISTHSVLYFAPAAASLSSGAALLLLHVSREGFFFVSSCMLTYAYAGLNRAQLGRFYWRRFLSAGIPYLCWSVIYFLFRLPTSHYASVTAAFRASRRPTTVAPVSAVIADSARTLPIDNRWPRPRTASQRTQRATAPWPTGSQRWANPHSSQTTRESSTRLIALRHHERRCAPAPDRGRSPRRLSRCRPPARHGPARGLSYRRATPA